MDENLPEQNHFVHFATRYPVVDSIGQGQADTFHCLPKCGLLVIPADFYFNAHICRMNDVNTNINIIC